MTTPYAGNYLNPTKIKVWDANDIVLENYKVIAAIDRITPSTDSEINNGDRAILDLSDFVGMEDPFVVLTAQKTARTDADGIASLN